jgi:hypothetical protein
MNEIFIQEFIAKEAMEQQLKVAQAKIKAFEADLPKSK